MSIGPGAAEFSSLPAERWSAVAVRPAGTSDLALSGRESHLRGRPRGLFQMVLEADGGGARPGPGREPRVLRDADSAAGPGADDGERHEVLRPLLQGCQRQGRQNGGPAQDERCRSHRSRLPLAGHSLRQ